ncbi:bola protein [Polychytrium aggregatum]|uniref:bola protein n=1 Tax=Polychytrium aggregatum TaxID=110093 RepID=UPI0022FE11FA|nr:bola protein [Polychytrium aggregatum]KAI9209405.1 bola protein [Polychytrium aggregatum]
MSAVSTAELEQIFKDKLQAEHVSVVDTSNGCGQCFEATIVSSQFEGKSLIQRHRLVNESAKDEIARIHAFSQKTLTPAQWAEKQKQQQQ